MGDADFVVRRTIVDSVSCRKIRLCWLSCILVGEEFVIVTEVFKNPSLVVQKTICVTNEVERLFHVALRNTQLGDQKCSLKAINIELTILIKVLTFKSLADNLSVLQANSLQLWQRLALGFRVLLSPSNVPVILRNLHQVTVVKAVHNFVNVEILHFSEVSHDSPHVLRSDGVSNFLSLDLTPHLVTSSSDHGIS